MREFNVEKWNSILSFWESQKTGTPICVLKSVGQLDDLIEVLTFVKNNAIFDERSSVSVGMYENTAAWMAENPHRPRWNLSVKIGNPKGRSRQPSEQTFSGNQQAEELPHGFEGNPQKRKLPWEK